MTGSVTVIDYGAGNLRSVVNAISSVGYSAKVTDKPADILSAEVLILPGVGSAGATMKSLQELGLIQPIRDYIAEDKPFFGICIGMQVLLSEAEEGGRQSCLDVIEGNVKMLKAQGLKIPHIGWNQVNLKETHPAFNDITNGSNFYFVHSYYTEPLDENLVLGTTEYGMAFPSVIHRGRLLATQFHPEKSGTIGLKLYANFLNEAFG
ncbi:MAG: imidazole glycerol phosphate synthase subunit HisH [Chloroflexi bacterium]|nr:imidazole glycerol phosphate synthase subunit HisH [Chloroflexota bacterium]